MLLFVGLVFLAVLEDTVLSKLEPENHADVCFCTCQEWASAFIYVFAFSYILFALVMSTVSDPVITFDLLFAIPIVALCLLMLYTFRDTKVARARLEREHQRAASEVKTSAALQGETVVTVKDKPRALTIQTPDYKPDIKPDMDQQKVDDMKQMQPDMPTVAVAIGKGTPMEVSTKILTPEENRAREQSTAALRKKKHRRTASEILRGIKGNINKEGLIHGTAEARMDIKIIAMRAVIFILVAELLRAVDINFCNSQIVFMYGHGWWHTLSAYAAHCIICFSSYVRADLYMKYPKIHWYPACSHKLLGWKLMPTVVWHDDDLLVSKLEELEAQLPVQPEVKLSSHSVKATFASLETIATELAQDIRRATVSS